jgi:hypothetical protein
VNGHPTTILPANPNIVGRLRAPPQEPPIIPAAHPEKLDSKISEWSHVKGRKSRRVRDADNPSDSWDNANDVARSLGCSHSTVDACCDGRRERVRGKRLEWVEDD